MKRKNYTMIEILVVISIIIILAGMTLAAAGFLQRLAAENRTKAQIKLIEGALAQYNADWGFYPQQSSVGAIKASWFSSGGLTKPNGKLYLDWTGAGYETSGGQCLDAFDQPIYYQCPGTINSSSCDIWSGGYDQKFGDSASSTPSAAQTTSEDNDDICNWKRNM